MRRIRRSLGLKERLVKLDEGFGEIRNRYHRGSGGTKLRNSVVGTRGILGVSKCLPVPLPSLLRLIN